MPSSDWASMAGQRRTRKKEKGANGTLKCGSHSRGYILARLDRDGQAELAGKR
jgi:hypothetical protein